MENRKKRRSTLLENNSTDYIPAKSRQLRAKQKYADEKAQVSNIIYPEMFELFEFQINMIKVLQYVMHNMI